MTKSNLQQIDKHNQLICTGKKSALDFNLATGEIQAHYTISNSAEQIEGAGTPPAPQGANWIRIL